jgi:hypothetical protein
MVKFGESVWSVNPTKRLQSKQKFVWKVSLSCESTGNTRNSYEHPPTVNHKILQHFKHD